MPAHLLPYPDTAERRLRRALHQLEAALAEQRAAVGAFRTELCALQHAMAGLDGSARALGRTLDEAAAETAAAREAAQRLERSAAALERAAGG
jgi:chromosome segregation ATPase